MPCHRQVSEGSQQSVEDDRLHHVELELTGGDGCLDRMGTASDPEAQLQDVLGYHRVDLAGHDGRTGLQLRQRDFADPRLRTGGKEAEVVGDLGHDHGCNGAAGSQGRVLIGVGHGVKEVVGECQIAAGEA